MKTLIEIKNEVAKDAGFNNWNYLTLVWAGFSSQMEPYHDEAAKHYAAEALREATKQIIEQQGSKDDGQVYRFSCTEIILELINELK